MEKPFVYIAGAGPGNPKYMTIRTMEALKQCDVVIYDNLVDETVLYNCPDGCEKIYAGKAAGHHYMKQEEITALIVKKALEDKKVLRLKGGDPFVFGRGPEECEELKKAGIPYEIVPGVTSAISVPMAAGIPVTNRLTARSFTVITGHTAKGKINDEINFNALAQTGGTLVFLMGLGAIDEITSELIKGGIDAATPAAVISDGTGADQYVLRSNVAEIAKKSTNDKRIKTPAIIVIGQNAELDLQSHIAAKDKLLENAYVYCLGTFEHSEKLASLITENGGRAHRIPHLKIVKKAEEELNGILENIDEYSVIAFTGRNSLEIFMNAFLAHGYDIRKLGNIKIAVIGTSTGAYLREQYHLTADIVPCEYTSDGLLTSLKDAYEVGSGKILLPRAEKGNDTISKGLLDAEIPFDEVKIYDTVYNENVRISIEKQEGCNTYAAFGSAAGVHEFFSHGNTIPEGVKIICIGKYTKDALEKYGTWDVEMAEPSTICGIINRLSKLEENR